MNTGHYLSTMWTMAEFELRKLRHDPLPVLIRSIQPALWLVIFGEVLGRLRGGLVQGYDYRQFLAPGILAQSVMFIAIFYGINLVWERDLGLLNKLLSTPSPHSAIVLGRSLAAGFRSIFQALIVFVLVLILGINLHLSPLSILGTLVIIVLTGIFFSSMSTCLAVLLHSRERVMGIGQALTMPFFFASNAIYPIEAMPGWLQVLARVNPLSYMVESLRVLLVTQEYRRLLLDVPVIMFATVVVVFLSARLFRRILG